MNKNSSKSITRIAFAAMMAAIVFVVTYFRFPLLGSKVHFANAMCLLAGLLLGPWGGVAAGLGSAIYDAIAGYGIIEALITFFSKAAMAVVCAVIAGDAENRSRARLAAASVVGAWTYVALYMLKTYVFQRFVYGYPLQTTWATMLSKLPASAINAVFAMLVTPVIYAAVVPALRKAGLWEKLR